MEIPTRLDWSFGGSSPTGYWQPNQELLPWSADGVSGVNWYPACWNEPRIFTVFRGKHYTLNQQSPSFKRNWLRDYFAILMYYYTCYYWMKCTDDSWYKYVDIKFVVGFSVCIVYMHTLWYWTILNTYYTYLLYIITSYPGVIKDARGKTVSLHQWLWLTVNLAK